MLNATSYTKIWQDSTTIPTAAGATQFNISNPLPSGLVEDFIVVLKGTSGAGGMSAASASSLISNLRVVFNGNQYFNFTQTADMSGVSGQNRLGGLVEDIGGFVAENVQSATAQDITISIPCGIQLGTNSRFEVDISYFAMGGGLTFAGNFELWIKMGNSSSACIVGNATSFPVPQASQTMMTIAIPSFSGAKVSALVLQGATAVDNLASVIVQPLGQFGMSPDFLRGASGASQNGYLYADRGNDTLGLTPANFCAGMYTIPLYDLDVKSGSVTILVTTNAGVGTETYTCTPILRLPTNGSGENVGVQTASASTSSASSILQRSEGQ